MVSLPLQCRRLCDHGHYHASALRSVPTAICLPRTRSFRLIETEIVAPSWHWWLPFLLWRNAALVPALRLSASIVPEEVLLHLDIDHLSNVFFVKFNVGNLLVCIVVDWLLRRKLLAVVRI